MAFDFDKEIRKFNRKAKLDFSNQSGSRKSFYSNSLFKEFAYSNTPASQDPEASMPIRDFQKYENYLYGRIDTEFDAVIPVPGTLYAIPDSDAHALSFVTTAFNKMKEEIRRDVAAGKIPNDIPHISDLKAYKGFEDINTQYNNWVKDYLKGSFVAYVDQVGKRNEIVDFKSYMKLFREHLMAIAYQLGAVNFSSFCLIYKSNIRNSGLAIEIADLDFSKGSDKLEFAEDTLFSYYVSMAEKHGFFVDYNAPWRLVFNLASSELTSRSGWSGLYTFFKDSYKKAYSFDLTVLKNLAFTTYRDFRNRHPSFVKQSVNERSCVVRKKIVRQKYTIEELEKEYPNDYWLEFYVDLKNQEKNLGFDKNMLEKIKEKSKNYEKYVDLFKALGYINEEFQDIPSTEGSYYYTYMSIESRELHPAPFENFDEYMKEIVKSYKL